MSVIKVVEDWSERTVSGEATKLTAKRVYAVEFDNADVPENRPLLAFAATDGVTSVPNIYAIHPYNNWLFVESKHVDTIGPFHYRVTVNYSSTLNPATGQPQTPLLEEPSFSWHFVTSNESIDRDVYGNAITNSSEEAFDPPVTRDFHDLVLRIERNELAYYPLVAYQYKGAVNSDVFLGFPAGTVLCTVMDATKARASNLVYWRITYEFHMRWDGWKLKMIEQGFREKNGTNPDGSPKYKDITDENGNLVSQPVLLDGSGKKLSQAAITAGNFVKREFVIRRSLPFSVLNL